MFHRNSIICCGFVLLCSFTMEASAEFTEYWAGHGDIGLSYQNGELDLRYRFGTDTRDESLVNGIFDPSDSGVYVRVGDMRGFDFSEIGSGFGFTGIQDDGDSSTIDLWALSQNNIVDTPFLGFDAEDLASSDWSGSVSFALRAVQFSPQGTGVADDAHFSLWSQGFGSTVFMDTLDGIGSGANDSDILELSTGGHSHYNFGFTEQGVYQVTLEAFGTHATDGFRSDTEVFTFAVGSATAIPEPSSVAALGLVGTATLILRRRRRPIAQVEDHL